MQYHHNRERLRLVIGIAAVSLILAACHGGSSGTAPYLPAGARSSQVGYEGATSSDGKLGALVSSCGHRVHIVLAGIVDCRFHEVGDRGDVFTLKNHTRGLILISPTSGTRRTTFTITGLVIGSGHFSVRDGKKNRLLITVRVTL